uniref:Tektin n=1 Tax=Mesocestoides corti TaxID=53468 RepID=A0A5K3F8F9_MESCO
MTTKNKLPHEHPFPSWYHSLHAYSRASEDLRRQAEKMRQRGRAIRIETDALTKFYQLDINNRLRHRINCNREWLQILGDLLRQILEVTQALGDTKIQADQFIADLGDAMTVNVETLTHRDTRLDGDYVQDDVQEELRREAKLQNDVKSRLQFTIDDAVAHLQALIAIRREVEKAIRDKEEAKKIDLDVYNSNEKSAPVGFKPFCDRETKNHLDLQVWEDLFRDLLSRGHEQVLKGLELCERLYDELNKAAHRLEQKAKEVAQRLRRRIFEYNSAIRELKFQHKQVSRATEWKISTRYFSSTTQ